MPEILVYIGAAVMVVLAVLAYRYWNSTAEFARRAREEQARLKHDALVAAAAAPTRPDDSVDTIGDTTGDTAGGDIPVEVPIDTEVVEEVQSDEPGEIGDDEPSGEMDETDYDEAEDIEQPAATDEIEEATEDIEQPVTTEEPDELLLDDATENNDQPAGTAPVDFGEDDTAREELEVAEDEPVEPAEDGQDRPPEAGEDEPAPDEEFKPDVAGSIAYRLIDELEPHSTEKPPADRKTATTLLEDVDEKLAALPTGIELMELPTVERRRVADLRRSLEKDRARLLQHRKRGAHRRGRRRRNSPND